MGNKVINTQYEGTVNKSYTILDMFKNFIFEFFNELNYICRSWSLGKASPLEVLAERESIYRLLAQTTPDNLNKDWKSYTLDPSTRYPNLNRTTVSPHQLVSLYDTDDIQNVEKLGRNLENITNISRKRRRGKRLKSENFIHLSFLFSL